MLSVEKLSIILLIITTQHTLQQIRTSLGRDLCCGISNTICLATPKKCDSEIRFYHRTTIELFLSVFL